MRRGAVAAAAVTAGILAAGAYTAAGARDRSSGAPALDGATVFVARGCAGCHDGPATPPSFGVGPPLLGAAHWAGERRPGVSAEAYLAESIRDPAAFRSPAAGGTWDMPRLGLTEAEIDALVAYLLGR